MNMINGNNRFVFWRDRWVIFGVNPRAIIVTFLMINLPMTLFNAGVCSGFNSPLFWIVGALMQVTTTLLLIYAAARDPGIIPATDWTP
jgi:hypothetical protein